MQDEVIVLFKNSKVEVSKNLKKIINKKYDEVQYVLIKVDEETDAFLLVPLSTYMKKFNKAKITFSNVITQHSNVINLPEEETLPVVLPPITKEVNSIIELTQYLHSLYRIKLTNSLSNSNESFRYEIIEFSEFNITMYDKDDNTIYSKKMNIKNQKGIFGAREIISSLRSDITNFITETNIQLRLNHYDTIKIDLYKNRWKKVPNYEEDDSLYGMYLPITDSYLFMHGNTIYQINQTVRSVFMANVTTRDNQEPIDISDIVSSSFPHDQTEYRYQDIWNSDFHSYMEPIVYLHHIYKNLRVISEINDMGTNTLSYTVRTYLQIDLFSKSEMYDFVTIKSKPNEIITLDEIMNKIDVI